MTTNIDRTAYPFTDRWIQLRAGRMHYVDEGTGEPVVFVHGTPTWSFDWRHLIRALSPRVRCIALDHMGFGLSERPRAAPYTPEWHADNFAEFIERLRVGPFTLVVHDFGGPIALAYALKYPEHITRLVVMNSWMWSLERDATVAPKARIAGGPIGRILYEWANLSLRVLMPSAYGNRRTLTREIHAQYLDRFPDRWSRGAVLWPLARALLGSSAFYDSLWAQRAKLANTPALIVWGMKDIAFQAHQLARWREALPAAACVQIAGAGHWPQEEAAGEVAAAVEDFLTRRSLPPHASVPTIHQ